MTTVCYACCLDALEGLCKSPATFCRLEARGTRTSRVSSLHLPPWSRPGGLVLACRVQQRQGKESWECYNSAGWMCWYSLQKQNRIWLKSGIFWLDLMSRIGTTSVPTVHTRSVSPLSPLFCLFVAGTGMKLELGFDEANCPPQPPLVSSQLAARAERFLGVIAPTRE